MYDDAGVSSALECRLHALAHSGSSAAKLLLLACKSPQLTPFVFSPHDLLVRIMGTYMTSGICVDIALS